MKKTRFTVMFHAILVAGASMMCTLPATAGEPGKVALPFTRTVNDAASLSMGGVSLLGTGNASCATFQNAALMSYADGHFDSGLTYQMFQPSAAKSDIVAFGVAGRLADRFGIGAGFSTHLHTPYLLTDENGVTGGKFKPVDYQINLGFSYKIIEQLSVGVNLKYLNSTLASDSKKGAFASDIFLMTKVSGFKAALGVSSLGTKVKSGDASFGLPSSATLGLGYGGIFGERHGLEVEVDADYYFHGAFSAAAGLSYAYNDMAFVRAGYRYGGKSVLPSFASVGLGCKFFGVKIDLAYLFASEAFNNTLSFTLGYSF